MTGHHTFKCVACKEMVNNTQGCKHWGPLEDGWYNCTVKKKHITVMRKVMYSGEWETDGEVLTWKR